MTRVATLLENRTNEIGVEVSEPVGPAGRARPLAPARPALRLSESYEFTHSIAAPQVIDNNYFDASDGRLSTRRPECWKYSEQLF